MFEWSPLGLLREHLRNLRNDQAAGIKVMDYPAPTGDIICTPVALAISLAERVLAAKAQRKQIIAALREAASVEAPPRNPNGGLNLLSWLGGKTPAWHTVFSYSSPDPHEPWFCSLDTEAQRSALLLVAHHLETAA
jgi:hypothetical protein